MPAGFETKTTFAREGVVYTPTWPSATVVYGEDLLPIIDESVRREAEYEALNTLTGSKTPLLLKQCAKGAVRIRAAYSGMEFPLIAALGFEAANMPTQLTAGVYSHLIEFDSTLSDTCWKADEGLIAGTPVIVGARKMRRGSYVMQKGPTTWTGKSCMVNDFTWESTSGAVDMILGLLGHSMVVTASSGELDDAEMSQSGVLHQDATLYLASFASLPLASSHIIEDVSDISFKFSNNLSENVTIGSATYMAQPERTEPPSLDGTFGIPVYGAEHLALTQFLENQTELSMKIVYEGETITGPYKYKITFWFPTVRLVAADIPVNGGSAIVQGYSFHASDQRPFTHTGFPVGKKRGPMMIELVTTTSSNPLI